MSVKEGEWYKIIGISGVSEGECVGRSSGDETLTLTRCSSCGLTRLYKALEEWKYVCSQGIGVNGGGL